MPHLGSELLGALFVLCALHFLRHLPLVQLHQLLVLRLLEESLEAGFLWQAEMCM